MTFISAFTKTETTLDFLSSISPVWVVMFLDILKIFRSLQNYWHRAMVITGWLKHLESSSDHALSFSRKVKSRFKNMSLPVFYGDLVYKLRRVNGATKFVSAGLKIVRHLRLQKYDPVIIEKNGRDLTLSYKKAPTPSENFKKSSDNTKTSTKAHYITTVDRLRTVSWCNYNLKLVWLNRFTGSQPSH